MKKLAHILTAMFVACGCVVAQPAQQPVKKETVTVQAAKVNHVVMHVDSDCTIAERMAVQSAANRWKDQTSGLADIQFVDDLNFHDEASVLRNLDNHVVMCIDSTSPAVAILDERVPPGAGVLAWLLPKGGIHTGEPMRLVIVSDRLDDERRERVILHEMGHVFGIGHLDDPDSTMTAGDRYGRPTCLTKSDTDAFCALNACGDKPMKPCGE